MMQLLSVLRDALDGMSATPCGVPAGHMNVSSSPQITLRLGYVFPAQPGSTARWSDQGNTALSVSMCGVLCDVTKSGQSVASALAVIASGQT